MKGFVVKVLGLPAVFFSTGAALILAWVLSLATLVTTGITRRRLGAGLTLLGLSGGIVVAFGYFWVSRGYGELPSELVAFPHSVHAGALRVDCLFCHRGAVANSSAGFPSLEQCMFCHRVLDKEKPGVSELVAAWEADQPLNWLRVNRLPDHVHFDHQAHSLAGITCSTCHGRVEDMATVRKTRSLKMGDCLSCHRANNAPTDCAICHY